MRYRFCGVKVVYIKAAVTDVFVSFSSFIRTPSREPAWN